MAADVALREALKAYGLTLGLAAVGVCRAEPFRAEADRLRQRQALGYRSEFEEPDIDRRCDPEAWLPGARSVIAVAMGYWDPCGEAAAPGKGDPDGDFGHGRQHREPRGWLSRYCRGKDYHYILHRQLERLMAWLNEHAPGGRHVPFVDTGPPIDRAVAARAGLGWFGKSNLLITREHGTYVFLGEIITTLDLPPDAPWHGTCGECTRCLDACPTGALTAAFTMNSSLCLSYVTQIRDWVPPEQRMVMHDKLFGCDTCQDVCPYSRAPLPGAADLLPQPEPGATPTLASVLRMTRSEFKRRYSPTAAGWRGKTVLQRNAIIALGNVGGPDDLPLLAAALGDGRAVMRGHAAWALGRLAQRHPAVTAAVVQQLQAALAAEPTARVRQELGAALSLLDPPPESPSPARSL